MLGELGGLQKDNGLGQAMLGSIVRHCLRNETSQKQKPNKQIGKPQRKLYVCILTKLCRLTKGLPVLAVKAGHLLLVCSDEWLSVILD